MKMGYLALAVITLSACAGNSEVVGERVTVQNGVVTNVCGEGNGMPECTDYNNRPYSENLEMKEPTDKQMVGELAARIRKLRPPEPYKGKGIKYDNETIHRKAGKAFGSA